MPIDECRVTLTHGRTDTHRHSHILTETHEQTNECTQYWSVINKRNAIIIASRWRLCERRERVGERERECREKVQREREYKVSERAVREKESKRREIEQRKC